MPENRRIVLTGGPGAGKTAISSAIALCEPELFVRVPEAASQVYTALGTRWDRLEPGGRREVQRRIFRLQRDQEEQLAGENPGKALLLDRGTIDGAAYWPDGADAYWQDLGTTYDSQLARYDQVLCLQTSAALGLYDGDGSNPCRFEDADAAVANGELLAQLWSGHLNVRFVPAFNRFEDKVAAARALIETDTATRPQPRR